MIIHPIEPVCFPSSRILILGSFPSVKSRESGFYYGHPQNRFWRVLAAVFDEPPPTEKEEKIALLFQHGIALWDVLARCEITGSSDASIRGEAPNDLSVLFGTADIRTVFTNGKTAHALYRKYQLPLWGKEDICLPSTSPANASKSLEKLIGEWKQINEELKKLRAEAANGTGLLQKKAL